MLVLSFVVAAFPAQAQAGYYGGGYGGYNEGYACAHPYVYPNGYYYCGQYQQAYQPAPQPVYQQPVYPAITATCYANSTSAPVGTSVQWTAYASGGTGSYTYSWSGSDALYGSGATAYANYYTPGYKTASVYVYSGGQTVNVACSSSVNVYENYQQSSYYYNNYQQTAYIQPVVQPVIQQGPTYLSTNASGLQVGCYSDPTTASINQPVTWNVEVTGGMAPYAYSWSGTDGISGTGATAIKYYQTPGTKSAVVSVTSADGRSTTWACSNTVAVRSNYVAPKPAVAVKTPVVDKDANLGASALFSLNNVPWGWVAVLVILVLFATVMYLVFNKTKI